MANRKSGARTYISGSDRRISNQGRFFAAVYVGKDVRESVLVSLS